MMGNRLCVGASLFGASLLAMLVVRVRLLLCRCSRQGAEKRLRAVQGVCATSPTVL